MIKRSIVHQLISAVFAERTRAAHHPVKSRREPSTDRSRPTCRRRTGGSPRTAGAYPANTRWETGNRASIWIVFLTFSDPLSYLIHVYEISNCLLIFILYLLIGGKWWTGGDQNKPTCASVLEASGTQWCFYEGLGMSLHIPSSFSMFADRVQFLNLIPFPAVVCCRREPLWGEGRERLRTHQTGPGFSE